MQSEVSLLSSVVPEPPRSFSADDRVQNRSATFAERVAGHACDLNGHPASSKLNLLEGFVKKVVDEVQANKELWNSTAIIVTMDEGGGYWDSGYIQPVDYFGDGTRIPTLVISPFTKPGHSESEQPSGLTFMPIA